jgi:hypothetical protein
MKARSKVELRLMDDVDFAKSLVRGREARIVELRASIADARTMVYGREAHIEMLSGFLATCYERHTEYRLDLAAAKGALAGYRAEAKKIAREVARLEAKHGEALVTEAENLLMAASK